MLRRTFLASSVAVAAAVPAWLARLDAQEMAQRKVAFLVGVSKYQKDGFENLSYCERDVEELAAELRKHGFQVATLTGAAATKAAVQAKLETVFQSLTKLGKQDVVLLGFSGHGVQALVKNPRADQPDIEDAFFCPVDAHKARTDTLISISWVMRQLDEFSGSSQNLVLVDACRNNPNKGGKNIDGSTAKELPNKISVLFSSSAGRRSYESQRIEHGIFTHVLLQGLRGEAVNKNGQVTWLNLASYAIDEVPAQARQLLDDPQAEQRPNLLGNLVSQPVLARLDTRPRPKPTEPPLLRAPFTATEAAQAQQAWADYLGVPKSKRETHTGITFALIPPGEFTMGSSAAERERMLKIYSEAKPEDFVAEPPHQIILTKPYYLAIHEVTVGQFRKFVTASGYVTEAEKETSDGGHGWNEETDRFEGPQRRYSWRNTGFEQSDEHPVVNVSWDDAVAFCEWVARQAGGVYRLPTETQWEYACRAGTTTAFWNGDDVEGLTMIGNIADAAAKAKWKHYANIPYQQRSDGFVFTAPVGRFPANAFGLYDMHGNVWEWCRDLNDAEYYSRPPADDPENVKRGEYRVVRGGSWIGNSRLCRAAYRLGISPVNRNLAAGFRVVCALA